MILINDLGVDLNKLEGNPSLKVNEMVLKKKYAFPDPYSYFVLSSAGKDYSITSNNSILLNPSKGYYTFPFSIDSGQDNVIRTAQNMFKGSNPLSGDAGFALDYALKKAGRKSPSLSGRL
jgi:hypothetical protein